MAMSVLICLVGAEEIERADDAPWFRGFSSLNLVSPAPTMVEYEHAQARYADATTLLRSIYRPTRVFIIAIAIAIAMISWHRQDARMAGSDGDGRW